MPKGSRKPQGGARLPSLRGAVMVDQTRGALRVRAWPKARPGRRHPTNEYWTKWLKAATYLYRYQPAKFQAAYAKMTHGTPWMPRDIFISGMRGRAFILRDDQGRTYYPLSLRHDISQSLDALAQLPGEMLFRNSGLWVPVPGGSAGDILRYVDDDTPPAWEPIPFTPHCLVTVLRGGNASTNYPVNSTTYAFDPKRAWTIPFGDVPYTHYRISVSGNSTQAGQSIIAQVSKAADHTVSIRGTNDDLTINNGGALYSSPWYLITATMDDYQELMLVLRGTNATVDLSGNFIDVHFASL